MVSRLVGKKKSKGSPGEKTMSSQKKSLREKIKPLTQKTDPWGTVSSHP
jgi:hypothetical protein